MIRDFLVSWKKFICETLNLSRESGITSCKIKPCHLVKQFQLRLAGNGWNQFLLIWSGKRFLSFKLFTAYPREKSCLPSWFNNIDEITFANIFHSEYQQAAGYCETPDFFFWAIFLVNSPPSLTTLRFPHSSLMSKHKSR